MTYRSDMTRLQAINEFDKINCQIKDLANEMVRIGIIEHAQRESLLRGFSHVDSIIKHNLKTKAVNALLKHAKQ